jgi:hypothetical protein
MKDVLVTIIVFWALWKLFGGKTVVHKYTFNQNNHRPEEPQRKAGDIRVEKDKSTHSNKLRDEAGEYIDYEEVK